MKVSRLRNVALNLGVLGATLLFLVLALEVFLRVAKIQPMRMPTVSIHRPSAIEGLVYELRPNVNARGFGWETIQINSRGFRSPERDVSKPVIAVIGDSYTFGHGVNNDETNPAYLQTHFPDAYVLNAGVDGYNIEQEAIVAAKKVAPLKPQVVIVEFVFNDMIPKGHVNADGTIEVGQGTETERAQNVQKSITKKGLLNFPGKYFLQKHSAVFVFLERSTKWLPFRKQKTETHDPITPEQLKFYERWFTVLDQSVITKHKLFVIWPESNPHAESRAFLRSLAERKGYVVVDLYETLGNGYKSLGWDYHPVASVHKEVANGLAEIIREKKMLP